MHATGITAGALASTQQTEGREVHASLPKKAESEEEKRLDSVTADPELFARLASRIEVSENGCWEWTGSCDGDGYARISFERKNCKASRVMWLAVHGIMPELFVLHTCDNPPCINPAHLFLGTNQDNIQDAAKKKRLWIQQPGSPIVGVPAINAAKTHCLRGHPFGPRDPSQKQRRCEVCVFIHRKALDARRKLERAA